MMKDGINSVHLTYLLYYTSKIIQTFINVQLYKIMIKIVQIFNSKTYCSCQCKHQQKRTLSYQL